MMYKIYHAVNQNIILNLARALNRNQTWGIMIKSKIKECF